MKHALRIIPFACLWIGWFGCLPVSFAALLLTGNDSGIRLWWASSVFLALAAWINWLLHRRDPHGSFAALIAGGMTCGTLADLYGFFGIIRFTEPLSMIIPLFGLGHVCYIGGMLTSARRLQLTGHPHWKHILGGAIALYGLIGTALWLTLVSPSDDLPSMHAPTAVYTLLLSTAAAAMAAVAALNRRMLAMGIGGLLFLISDGFLAVRLFQNNAYGIGDLCWITYGIGQMLIVYGAIFVCGKQEPDSTPIAVR